MARSLFLGLILLLLGWTVLLLRRALCARDGTAPGGRVIEGRFRVLRTRGVKPRDREPTRRPPPSR